MESVNVRGREIQVPVERNDLEWLLDKAARIETTSTKWIKLDEKISYLDEREEIVEFLLKNV